MGPGGEGWGPGVPGAFPFVSLYGFIPVMNFLHRYSRTLQSRIIYHAMPDGVTGRVAGVLCTSIA